MSSLPIIDFSQVRTNEPGENALATVAADVRRATAESGFFYLANHGIPDSIIQAVRLAQRAFFAATIDVKNAIAINQDNRGYLAIGQARMQGAVAHDQKEVFFWGAELDENHPDRRDGIPLCGANQWPDSIPDFRQSVLDYAAQINTIGHALLRVIALSLDAEADFFKPFYQDTLLRGQLIRYPQTTGDKDQFGVAPHTDFGCITLLLQETEGLEVLVNNHWIAAPPIEGTLVINIGDLLERWSNNRLPSTRHRVRNETGEARYSIAMFHDPSARAVINPQDLDPTITDTVYPPVGAADYIVGRNKGAFAHYGEVAGKS
ncbi:MAG: hypothetical protein KTR32_27010 [Granulosicoccus sp.]|nr:hypothetical protein [Granulosicoccus sp.]